MKTKTIISVIIFSIAMAALESAVVVYLRALYYPEGFAVAFKLVDHAIVKIEIMRELATVIMLLAVGYLAGKNFKERFSYFLLSFAVWDIFYYVWLKVFIDWPLTLWDWDILFLIPITWLGPVLAPLVCSVTMIVLSGVLLQSDLSKPIPRSAMVAWTFGSMLIVFTFIQDYGSMLIDHKFIGDYFNLMTNKDFIKVAGSYVPSSYNWELFWIGELLIIFGISNTSWTRASMTMTKTLFIGFKN